MPGFESLLCNPRKPQNDTKLPGFFSSAKWVHRQPQLSLLAAVRFRETMALCTGEQALQAVLFLNKRAQTRIINPFFKRGKLKPGTCLRPYHQSRVKSKLVIPGDWG